MRNIVFTSQFKRDVKKAENRHKDMGKLREAFYLLAQAVTLPARFKDHGLTGNWKNHRDLHLEPDWLLIYKVSGGDVFMVRTGSHSDIFKS